MHALTKELLHEALLLDPVEKAQRKYSVNPILQMDSPLHYNPFAHYVKCSLHLVSPC